MSDIRKAYKIFVYCGTAKMQTGQKQIRNNMRKFKTLALCLAVATAFSCKQQTQVTETDMKTDNEVIEAIMARRSIRKYKAEPVDKELLNKILECGINAPNAINKQSWEVRVIATPELLAEFKAYMTTASPEMDPAMVEGCFRGAPTMIVIANDTTFPFSMIDCGLMAENIMLSAWSLGVGSVCLGSPVGFIEKSEKAMERLGFSEGYKPAICIGLGYADETPDAKPRDMGKVKFVE